MYREQLVILINFGTIFLCSFVYEKYIQIIQLNLITQLFISENTTPIVDCEIQLGISRLFLRKKIPKISRLLSAMSWRPGHYCLFTHTYCKAPPYHVPRFTPVLEVCCSKVVDWFSCSTIFFRFYGDSAAAAVVVVVDMGVCTYPFEYHYACSPQG